ncbi:MAG: hypothetical protein PHI73_01695 [Patescibacteria group bacterium]|nr:hypothetical protein [Patescibacteria group bacterium]
MQTIFYDKRKKYLNRRSIFFDDILYCVLIIPFLDNQIAVTTDVKIIRMKILLTETPKISQTLELNLFYQGFCLGNFFAAVLRCDWWLRRFIRFNRPTIFFWRLYLNFSRYLCLINFLSSFFGK